MGMGRVRRWVTVRASTAVVDRWVWACFSLGGAVWIIVEWDLAPFSSWFVGCSAALLALAQLPVGALNWVRLAATAFSATAGALIVTVFGVMIESRLSDSDDPTMSALLLSLLVGVLAGWIAQARLVRSQSDEQAARAALAASRHAEVTSRLDEIRNGRRPRLLWLCGLMALWCLARRRR